jgi:hypothetical protein
MVWTELVLLALCYYLHCAFNPKMVMYHAWNPFKLNQCFLWVDHSSKFSLWGPHGGMVKLPRCWLYCVSFIVNFDANLPENETLCLSGSALVTLVWFHFALFTCKWMILSTLCLEAFPTIWCCLWYLLLLSCKSTHSWCWCFTIQVKPLDTVIYCVQQVLVS